MILNLYYYCIRITVLKEKLEYYTKMNILLPVKLANI